MAGSESLISSAGGALLIETAAAVGLDQALSEGLRPWRGRRAVHDPGKVLLDLAVAVALGGDCLADVAVVRAQPDLFGDVASDPTALRGRNIGHHAALRQLANRLVGILHGRLKTGTAYSEELAWQAHQKEVPAAVA